MISVKQTKFGDEGNCFAACVATLLECDINCVPFLGKDEDWNNYEEKLNIFLKESYQILISWDEYDTEIYSDFINSRLENTYYIVSGKAARGFEHAVIYKNGMLAHDPHPDNTGIENISHIYWFYHLFT
jgi:hypothetical protein